MAPAAYLKAIIAAGAKDFDAVSDHPYAWPHLPLDANPANAFTQIEGAPGVTLDQTLYSVLEQAGMADMPIWLTEMGAPSAGGAGLSEEAQKETVRQVLTYKFLKANVTRRLIYTLIDDPQSGSGYFGLYRVNGTAKLAQAVFAKIAKAA